MPFSLPLPTPTNVNTQANCERHTAPPSILESNRPVASPTGREWGVWRGFRSSLTRVFDQPTKGVSNLNRLQSPPAHYQRTLNKDLPSTMTTKAAHRRFVTINSSRICTSKDCTRHRRRTSRFCVLHERHQRWYGHPFAGAIPLATLRRHRDDFEEFIRKHRDTPQVIAATQVCQELIDWGVPTDKLSKWRADQYERFNVAGKIRDLRDQEVEGREVLGAAGGVWLLAHFEPRVLPDDLRLDYRIGLEVLKLRPTRYRVKLNGKGEKRDVVGGLPRRAIGQHLRRKLATFFVRVTQGIADEEQAAVDHAALLATRFDPEHDATNPTT